MKRILITGATSWIGSEVEAHLAAFPGRYGVERVSLRGDAWKERSWEGFDSVLHLAALSLEGLAALEQCLSVNRNLTVEVAKKARAEGVSQLIFTSTMHVYGAGSPGSVSEPITLETEPCPISPYGISKLEGERALADFAEDGFGIATLRPPLVYGPGCSGNFALLAKLARTTPIFPEVDNRRSMIFSRNLAELIRLIMEDGRTGLFLPQDQEPIRTSDLVALLATAQGSRVRLSKSLAPAARAAARYSEKARKVFGSSWYRSDASDCGLRYRLYSLGTSVQITLGNLESVGFSK